MLINKEFPQMINGNFEGKDILSLNQFDVRSIFLLFKKVDFIKKQIKNKKQFNILRGVIVTLLFYEPSSRTFGSFSSAVKRLGGQTIAYQNPLQTSSAVKGESLEDSARTFDHYSDCIIIRHPEVGSALKFAKVVKIPVINAGDGGGEHPTQTLIDLYTIFEQFGRLNNLNIIICGDPIHSRTIRSLVQGLSLFKNNKVFILSPKSLRFPKRLLNQYRKKGLKIVEIDNFDDLPKKGNIWYWNRIQKERFNSLSSYKKVLGKFTITKKILAKYGNKNMILLDPLPRVEEISSEVDSDSRSVYLSKQMANGLFVRMALLSLVFARL